MATSDIICVTNKSICEKSGEIFLERIRKVAEARPLAIILREKDLSLEEYRELAGEVSKICKRVEESRLIIHNFYEIILENGIDKNGSVNEFTSLHMPLWKLEELYKNQPGVYAELRSKLLHLGASCHSVEDAKLAEKLGCTYIIAGHIYNTDCKKGLEGRGLGFLRDVGVWRRCSIPRRTVHSSRSRWSPHPRSAPICSAAFPFPASSIPRSHARAWTRATWCSAGPRS